MDVRCVQESVKLMRSQLKIILPISIRANVSDVENVQRNVLQKLSECINYREYFCIGMKPVNEPGNRSVHGFCFKTVYYAVKLRSETRKDVSVLF